MGRDYLDLWTIINYYFHTMQIIKENELQKALLGVTNELAVVSEELDGLTEKLARAQLAYDLRFARLLLESSYGNQPARDAGARIVCNEEGLVEPLENYKFEARRLLTRRETLIVISQNIRSLSMGLKTYEN